jgi:Leucine-rich repeat (LRR) protein
MPEVTNNTPRLLAAAKEFNIGKETLIDFLANKGYDMGGFGSPNARLTSQMYVALQSEFQQDKANKRKFDQIALPKGSVLDAMKKKEKEYAEAAAKKKEAAAQEEQPIAPVAEVSKPESKPAPEPKVEQPKAEPKPESKPVNISNLIKEGEKLKLKIVQKDHHLNIQNVVQGIQQHAEGLIAGIQHGLMIHKKEQYIIQKNDDQNIAHIVASRIDEYIRSGSVTLDLSSLGLLKIPEDILVLDNLRVLIISRNKIEKLAHLPPQIEVLFADYNGLTTLENLPVGLKALSVLANPLSEIKNLPVNLEELIASNTNLTRFNEFPASLRKLNLSYNKIQDISIPGHLLSLNISNNQIVSIGQIEGWEELGELMIANNAIQDLPEHIIGEEDDYNCINSLRNWINELERKSEKNTYIKLILLGNSNVGKSSIIRALKKLPYDKDIVSTHGISIDTLTFSDPEQPVDLQIWDLGGQEIYYGTHRMFMMSQSVQLVAFDAITEATSVSPDRLLDSETVRNIKLPFYINRVQELSPNSKIVIVQNKIEEDDTIPEYLSEYRLKNRFRQVSVSNNRSIRTLSAEIHDAATELGIYGQPVPFYWEKVRRYFSNNLKRPEQNRLRIIDKSEFRDICIKAKVLVEGIDDLLEHLHNIGALYYRKELGENIIVDQVWALKAIYKIFDRNSQFYFEMRNVYYGKCTLRTLFDDFDRTENNYSIEDKWIFLKYMQSCGLCFSIKQDDSEEETLDTFFVFPEFLPSVKPNFVKLWGLKQSKRQVLKKQFKFLPYYPLHKFISRFGNKTMHNYLWRNGILICLNNETFDGFLVEADFEKHTIQITMDDAVEEWQQAIIAQLQIGKEIVGEEWEVVQGHAHLVPSGQKPAAELLEIKNVVQDSVYEGLTPPPKPRVVISYAKEDKAELDLLVNYLDAYKVDHWYDGKLSNRADWDDEISHEFENADGYIILLSADYMHSRKKYIQEKEVPIILKRMMDQKKFCTILTVKSFSLNDAIHGDICKIPAYKKGTVLPAISNKSESTSFMDEFVLKEVLKKL